MDLAKGLSGQDYPGTSYPDSLNCVTEDTGPTIIVIHLTSSYTLRDI